jgi:hypothetical protein
MHISDTDTTGHVSVIGSTLTGLTVCALLQYPPSNRTPWHLSGCSVSNAPHRAARRVLRVPEVPYRRTASVFGTHSAHGIAGVPLVGADPSFVRRVVCRPMATAGSWVLPATESATSASSARPSRT